MTNTTQTLPAETGGTDITRFNGLRHGVLSRYTVLPELCGILGDEAIRRRGLPACG